ncbi:MAG TPA: glycoside hydrolase family 3 N-terminal domain-containing protein [Cyclobacteriaceae bacterium]|nr:glycoside hydrolase family 3 N-terminal domain-containing protein [Cyclobacteriaceae bacterium]
MKKLVIPFLFCTLLVSCNTERSARSGDSIDSRVDSVLKLMTVEEKAGQLTLYTSDWDVTGPSIRAGYQEDIKAGKVGAVFNAYGAKYTRQLQEIAVKETRLGIPLLFGYDVIHGHKTIFPIPIGEASSWDLEAIERSARVAAEEASADGLHWTFAPMVDISRDPRWGRVMEGAGEDTYLGSLIGAARVKGFQGNGISEINSVAACVKHFAAYGASQAGRDYHTVDMSDRVLREVYLPPYKAAVDAGAATVMTSFNELDGTPATANKYLMDDILRKEWGFQGFVVTDYTSIMEMLNHGNVADSAEAAAATIKSGVDMDMQAGFFQYELPQLVKDGKVSEAELNTAVRRVLRIKFQMGLFDDPYRYSDEQREKSTIGKPEFKEASRDVARKSIVLLKNNGVLPLSKSVKTIALIGPLGKSRLDMIGAWSAAGKGDSAVSIFDGIRAKVSPSTRVLYAKGCNVNDDSTKYFGEAVSLARQADIVIMSVGEAAWMSGEASSRGILDLPGAQQKLVEEIHKTGKPVVVLLSNGRPLTIPWIDKNIPAVVETWYLGTQAGHAIADVLFGDYNPSGKLPVTFPYSVGQVPIFYSAKNTGRPRDPNNKYSSKYLDIPNDPLYPFGYGLSYTTFEYGEVNLSAGEVSANQNLSVTCRITNSGSLSGTETVQLYIRDMVGSVTRPLKELKGFQQVKLGPGEFKDVVFTLTPEDLSFYRKDMTFGPEAGRFKVFVGPNSRDVKEGEFELTDAPKMEFQVKAMKKDL